MAFNPVRACRENTGLGCHRVKHDLRISHEIILHEVKIYVIGPILLCIGIALNASVQRRNKSAG